MHHIFFIQSFINGHIGFFHLFWTEMCKYLSDGTENPLSTHLGWLILMVVSFLRIILFICLLLCRSMFCLLVCMCTTTCLVFREVKRGHLIPMLQAAMLVLETQPGTLVKSTSNLTCWAIAPLFIFSFFEKFPTDWNSDYTSLPSYRQWVRFYYILSSICFHLLT